MSTELTPDEHLIAALKVACDDRIVKIPGPLTLSAAFPGQSPPFKSVKLTGGEEYLLSGVRQGKRSAAILMLNPIDEATFGHLEVETSKIDTQLPELEPHLVDTLAGYLAARQTEAGIDPIEARYIPSGMTLKRAITYFVSTMPGISVALEARRALEAEKAAEKAYAGDDLWGSW